MKIKIEEASATQLARFAGIQFGIEVDHRKGRDHILSLLANVGFTGSEVDVEDAATAPGEPAKAPVPVTAAGPRRKVKILIPKQDIPGGNDPVVVGVNGVVARIVRGQPVDVPVEYVEALRNANKVAYEKGPNGEPVNPHFVPTHPFTVLGEAA